MTCMLQLIVNSTSFLVHNFNLGTSTLSLKNQIILLNFLIFKILAKNFFFVSAVDVIFMISVLTTLGERQKF